MPKGLKMKKFIEGPGGMLIQDTSYVGDDAWDEDQGSSQDTVAKVIGTGTRLSPEQKKDLMGDLLTSVELAEVGLEERRPRRTLVDCGSGGWRSGCGHHQSSLTTAPTPQPQLRDGGVAAKFRKDQKGRRGMHAGRKGVSAGGGGLDRWSNGLGQAVGSYVGLGEVGRHGGATGGGRWGGSRPGSATAAPAVATVTLATLEGKGLGGTGVETEESGINWRERLGMWKGIIANDKLSEQIDSVNAKYVVDFDMQEVEKSLWKDVEKASGAQGGRALWISKRWWHYRPKLPYTYFLDKLDCSEVAAVVFSEDLKKIYVTMKEGFPSEYVVDVPLDPFLFEIISSSGVEVDLLQKSQIHYFFRVVVALAPGLLILYLIRESVMLLHITSRRYLYKKYNQLFDMAYADNFILPVESADEMRSMYKEVILGGDVWDLLDEIMIYMNNPLQYYEKQVPFVRAPSFVFVDEIDAIAGRHARKDPRRRATFEALITQLDGEKEKTGVDRFSLRQAVIFICATNRPDELDPDFVRPGRIDRRLYIGLPDAKQRIQIFGVHSSAKKLAKDVDFGKLVFRTVGYSGADIRNLVNEAAIMSVRKGHSMITQQDIIDVLDKQLLEGMGVLLTEEEQQKCEASVSLETKRLLAVHEAGHILLAHIFPRFDWHAFSQLLPGGEIAREMVISPRNSRLGLTALVKRFGMVTRPDSPDGELIKYKWDDPNVIPADMTVEVSELFTRELSREVEDRMKQMFPVMYEDLAEPFQINMDLDRPLPVNDRVRYQPLDVYPAPLHQC
uniref:ATP-dependent zinc metalloprotease FTSH 12, chloroplastic n=1 Tax=Ananas comosus var. bracteatus TaxID=296719 RepID=A0A6V7P9I4_ANACO|nr:unnamed protein product [Ananas comosus var. bracteatus]